MSHWLPIRLWSAVWLRRDQRRTPHRRRTPLRLEALETRVVPATVPGFREDAFQPRWYDFGPAAAPQLVGGIAVSEATTYSAARGYGWLSGTVATRDRGSGPSPSDDTRDYAYTADATFAVD